MLGKASEDISEELIESAEEEASEDIFESKVLMMDALPFNPREITTAL